MPETLEGYKSSIKSDRILKEDSINKEVSTYRCHRNICAKAFKEFFYEIYLKEGIYEIRL